jgi:diadenosine tetraphosphatase ApaH/serine/threonine PP2A family protein phosphatase
MVHAILSDIHGNLEALEAVLAELERVQPASVQCLGDFVGYGGSPNECIALLRPRLEHAVAGNHDLAACGKISLGYFNASAAAAALWTDQVLTPEHRRYLLELPLAVEWRNTLLVHASPSDPGAWHYVVSPERAAGELDAVRQGVCFIGHSHFPGTFVRPGGGRVRYTRAAEVPVQDGQQYLVNVPSVGQPRDGDPRAGYLLYDEAARVLRHVRLEYDVQGAMQRILDAGLPRFLAERLQWGE